MIIPRTCTIATTYEAILHLDLDGKTVVIIGEPASGKSHLATDLSRLWPDHYLYRTDHYMDFGYEASMYEVLKNVVTVQKLGGHTITEGIQAYRMLRKGVELTVFYPDIVIEIHTTPDRIERTYETERGGMKKGLKGFNKVHQKILNDYRAMDNPHPPVWYTVENHY